MKKLYLLRHANSSWFNPFIKDFDRPINKNGRKRLDNIFNYFSKNKIKIDLLLSSSAKRAIDTSEKILRCPNIKNLIQTDDLYKAHQSKIQDLILSTDDSIDSLMIVGHNPGLNLFAYELFDLTKNIETCSFLEIDLNIDSWKDLSKSNATLKKFYNPN